MIKLLYFQFIIKIYVFKKNIIDLIILTLNLEL